MKTNVYQFVLSFKNQLFRGVNEKESLCNLTALSEIITDFDSPSRGASELIDICFHRNLFGPSLELSFFIIVHGKTTGFVVCDSKNIFF